VLAAMEWCFSRRKTIAPNPAAAVIFGTTERASGGCEVNVKNAKTQYERKSVDSRKCVERQVPVM
jgi:hypothetical protein